MENFIVSARKYRPQTFRSVVGQSHITSTLKNAIERGQLAHAYLFCGPRGVGKTTCARIFAKAINCLSPVGSEACNECESCRSFNENRSLNIHELDAASNNSVDDIRTLTSQVRVLPQQGSYSVYIIDEVHMLSTAAFNAFLKTLEEPPQHAIFILATTEKHKIIPTILSRCQIYDFNRIRVEDSVEYLRYIASEEGVTADDESLNLISQKADGGMRDALSMFDKAVSFCGKELRYQEVAKTLNVLDYDTYFGITHSLTSGNFREALITFDNVLSLGFSAQSFISGLNRHFRDLLMAKDSNTLQLIEMTGTLLERYRTQAQSCDVGMLFGAIDILTEIDSKIKISSNQRLLIELGLMKISGLGQKKNSDTLASGYKLPPLNSGGTAETPQRESANSPSRPTVQPEVQQRAAAESQKSAHPEQKSVEPAIKSSASQSSASHTASQPATAAKRATRAPLISISELLNGDTTPKEEGPKRVVERVVDPEIEDKLKQNRSKIIEAIKEFRPRFVAPFEKMEIERERISLTVPSEDLAEEILRSSSEIVELINESLGLSGLISISVKVDDKAKAQIPIKIEERVGWLTKINPELTELRKALGLESEI